MHHIQKHILRTLMYTKWARFRDMRPPRVDSNAYSYHLKALQKEGYVERGEKGYCLTPAGLFYVDRVSMTNLEPRQQPKIITMTVLKNTKGNVLLYSKLRQPFIGSWVLPFGKVHLTNESLDMAAKRELEEKAGATISSVHHVGDCYIHATIKSQLVSSVLAHIFTATMSEEDHIDTEKYAVQWMSAANRQKLTLGPAVEAIISETETEQPFFFKTFDVEW
jgi:ADP-ribose pyrophosphatase YjhB (NUDIX family)